MECHTDLPGVQVYTGNYLDEHDGKKGCVYREHAGVALETQYFPNSLNIERFEKPVLKAGEHKILTTRYLFSVDESESEQYE
jgi:aldose 1-epimerase